MTDKKGAHVEPFCKRFNRLAQCAESDLNVYGKHVPNNCAPIYKQTKANLLIACVDSFRCQNPMDAVVPTFGCNHVLWKANEEKLKNIVFKRKLESPEKPWITIDDLENSTDAVISTFRCNHPLWKANEEKIKDIVLTRNPENPEKLWITIDDFDHCLFGNIKMALGEELAQDTDIFSNTSSCVRCVCEIPPVPTCIRLSNCTPRPFNLSEPLYASTQSP